MWEFAWPRLLADKKVLHLRQDMEVRCTHCALSSQQGAKTYLAWRSAAEQLDLSPGIKEWKDARDGVYYKEGLIEERMSRYNRLLLKYVPCALPG